MKRKFKKIFSIILALMVSVGSLPLNGLVEFTDFFSVVAEASGEFEDDELDIDNNEFHVSDDVFRYKVIDNEKAILCECESSVSGKIEIPSIVDDIYAVVGIGENAFYYNEQITEVVIPDSVVSIGAGAFAYCPNLVSVSMGSGVTDIGERAFEYCSSLSTVEFGENIEVLSASAFSNCTALETIEIPSAVSAIGEKCFYQCINLSELKFNENLKTIGNNAFASCESLVDLSFPDSVTEIGDYVFQNCEAVQELVFGSSLTTIGEGAFSLCDSLINVTVPDSVESLGRISFARNENLKSVNIGKSVSYVGDLAFYQCPSLNAISVSENNLSYSSVDNILYNKDKTTLIQYPLGRTEPEYSIPDGVISITQGAFYGCETLNKIVMPDTVTVIETAAFYDCTSLSEIDISENIKEVETIAFYNTGFYNNSDNWKDGVLYLGNVLLASDGTVPEIYIVKDGTKTIADGGFKYCENLVSLTVSDGVENIGYGAFWGCKSLENVKISSDIKRIDEYTFFGSKIYNDSKRWNDNGLYVDNVLVAVDAAATGRFLIKSGTTFVADKVFASCKNLEEIIVPETVTAMSENAFAGIGDAVVCCLPDSYAAEYCAANNINHVVSSLESLKLDTTNVKIDYTVGDPLNTDGLRVYAVYSGGIETEIPLSDVTFSISEFKKAGQFRVSVSYNGKSSYYTVNVSDAILESVEIKTLPAKTEYILGEEIDLDGLVLTAFYSNSIQKEIYEGFMASGNTDKLGKTVITVSYSENGVTAQTQYTVTVSEGNNAVVSAENKSVLPGETVSVPVKISGNLGLMGFAINIAYDESVFTPVSVTGGDMLANGMLNDSIGGNVEKGNLKVVFSSTENIIADGLLFTVEFKVDKFSASDIYNFDVSYIESDTFDENWNDVTLICKDFNIEINNSINDLPVFYADDIEGKSGMNVTVPVMLGSGIGLTDFDLILSYDESLLKPLSVSAGEVLSGEIESNCNDASGELVLKWSGEAEESNGVAAYVIFEISEDALGETELKISCADGFEAECSSFLINISKPGTGSSAELYSTTVSVLPGKTVDIPVYISGNTGIMGFGLNISYDSEKLTPVSVKKGDLLSSGMLDNNIGLTDGSYKIIWNHSADIAGDGLLLTLSFKAAEELNVQSVPVSIEYIKSDTYNEAWDVVELITNDVNVMVDGLVINPSGAEMFTGETLQLSAAYNYSQESCRVTWTSENTEIADVDENGKVTAISFGTAVISVTTSDGLYSASCEIDVIPRTLTIEWVVDGKTTVQTIKEGDKITPPDIPEKDGHTFQEWTPEVPDIMAQENLSFTAVWTVDSYTVKYNANGGLGAPSEQTKIYGTALTLSTTEPTRTGYVFTGWNTKADGSGMGYTAGARYTENASTTLFAQWEEIVLTSIEMKTSPLKTNYYVGDTLDTTGLTLTAKYSDGSSKTISSGFTCTPTTLTTKGDQKITVIYEGKTTEFTVNVADVVPLGIEIKTMPLNTKYFVGDTLSTEGLTLSISYNNGKTETVSSGFTCTPTRLDTAGTQKITVTYDGNSTTFDITVTEVTVSGIEVKTNPAETSYYVGDTLNTAGLTLIATYNNGTSKTVTSGFTCSPETLETEGVQKITVTYEGKTASFNVSVAPVKVTELEIVTVPGKISYKVGDKFDPTGLIMNAVNSKGETIVVTEGFVCTPEILDKPGTQVVTVSYSGKSVMITIVVAEPEPDTYTVKFIADGEIIGEASYEAGEVIVKPSVPAKEGYKFMGWTPDVPNEMLDYDLTFTAIFEKSYICPDCGGEILGEDEINVHIAAEARMNATVKIKNNNGSNTIKYGETLRLTAITTNMPADAKVCWYVDGEKEGEGEVFNVSFENGTKTVEVKIVDSNGNVLKNASGNDIKDSESVTVKGGFFQKIISFFKNLFRMNRTVVQSIFKGVL